jgi:hypothetical protein
MFLQRINLEMEYTIDYTKNRSSKMMKLVDFLSKHTLFRYNGVYLNIGVYYDSFKTR